VSAVLAFLLSSLVRHLLFFNGVCGAGVNMSRASEKILQKHVDYYKGAIFMVHVSVSYG
jgi:hypothetical protein